MHRRFEACAPRCRAHRLGSTLSIAWALMALGTSAAAEPPKAASPATQAAQAAAAAALPAEDGRDERFARRGFLGTQANPQIRTADGRVAWDLSAFNFVEGAAPATVNPALWRHARLLRLNGLFAVADGIWQVRGFDVSNMTIIRGKTGWIIVDPLSTRETAAAALALVNDKLGRRPVSAVIYSHSHTDHFGGVRGIVDAREVASGRVPVIAPAGFMAEAGSENVLAGSAMGRRAMYQFGIGLGVGPAGNMGSGVGQGVAIGTITLLPPTDTVSRTGEIRVVDGVPLEFQIVSGSEAPAELNVYIASAKTFLASEMATCSLHNILTLRGAKVRDAVAWSDFLDEAAQRYAPKSEAVISSHCWPRFGTKEIVSWLSNQRDNYRYLHDQTVGLMNRGETPAEIAEELVQPESLAKNWYNLGYYGTYSHDAKAVYQSYLGWYDSVPANLNPWPPAERSKRSVDAMGGAGRVLELARSAMAKGDYRWSSDLLNQLVFADPANREAKLLLADSYEQQGYQAESGIWRNSFLSAASELRNGKIDIPATVPPADLAAAIPTILVLRSAATRYRPDVDASTISLNIVLTDRAEQTSLEANRTTLFPRTAKLDRPDATISLTMPMLFDMLFRKAPVDRLISGGAKIEGDVSAVQAVIDRLAPVPPMFDIVVP